MSTHLSILIFHWSLMLQLAVFTLVFGMGGNTLTSRKLRSWLIKSRLNQQLLASLIWRIPSLSPKLAVTLQWPINKKLLLLVSLGPLHYQLEIPCLAVTTIMGLPHHVTIEIKCLAVPVNVNLMRFLMKSIILLTVKLAMMKFQTVIFLRLESTMMFAHLDPSNLLWLNRLFLHVGMVCVLLCKTWPPIPATSFYASLARLLLLAQCAQFPIPIAFLQRASNLFHNALLSTRLQKKLQKAFVKKLNLAKSVPTFS